MGACSCPENEPSAYHLPRLSNENRPERQPRTRREGRFVSVSLRPSLSLPLSLYHSLYLYPLLHVCPYFPSLSLSLSLSLSQSASLSPLCLTLSHARLLLGRPPRKRSQHRMMRYHPRCHAMQEDAPHKHAPTTRNHSCALYTPVPHDPTCSRSWGWTSASQQSST
jgi:hypothetical protein